ncbi:MAG: hypothetical protein GTO18_18585 [Anaerolineales bacterium]|nr:hypothetical protein [Anaerolineales bacterium]
MGEEPPEEELSPLEQFLNGAHSELDRVSEGLKEIGLLIEQSQGEVDKLAQRNANITSQLHQIQAQFETVPREDIKDTYESAQDTQQRLFTMRGQLEKLQSDQTNLIRYEEFLIQTLEMFESGVSLQSVRARDGGDTIIEKIIEAQEDEKRRISQQIHDGPAQALSNFILQTEIALRLFDVDPDKARDELKNLKDAATSTFAHVRDFIFDLRPMMLDDLGLVPTIRRYTEAFKEKTGLDITLVMTGSERRIEAHREVLCFRAIQELLGIIRDQAQATQVKVTLFLDEVELRVSVEDNGRGYFAEEPQDQNGGRVETLSERLSQVGGELTVEPLGDEGTRVSFVIPVRERAAE